MKSKQLKWLFQILVAFSEYLNFNPETPGLNLLIACSQNLLDFFTHTVTYMIIFSPHNKSWHRKAPDAPLWNESWFFMFSGSEGHQASFRLCSFIFLFWYSCSITWSWVTYICASLYKSFQNYFLREHSVFFFLIHLRSLLKTISCKVRTFWEAHIIWKNLPHGFDVY